MFFPDDSVRVAALAVRQQAETRGSEPRTRQNIIGDHHEAISDIH